MMQNQQLIIFVKNPIPGKVKTRLAKDIGNKKALSTYQYLLHHTYKITNSLHCNKAVYYSEKIEHDDLWPDKDYEKYLQQGDHLGERMHNAFNNSFNNHYESVVIIGSDCLSLTTKLILSAFNHLNDHDYVIGPAKDGGYYLLGMKKLNAVIFKNKIWGSDTVLKDTIRDIKKSGSSFSQLPVLSDIDTIMDLRALNINL